MTGSRDDSLILAEQYIVEAEMRITRQIMFIAQLERCGRDTAEAESLLMSFERSLNAMLSYRRSIQADHEPDEHSP